MAEMTLIEEKQLRIEAGEIAVNKVLAKLGLVVDEISEREAFRLFTPAKVRSWSNQGLIKGVKTGTGNSKKTYSRIELETIKNLEDKRKLR